LKSFSLRLVEGRAGERLVRAVKSESFRVKTANRKKRLAFGVCGRSRAAHRPSV